MVSGFSLGNEPAVAPNLFSSPNNWRQAATMVETGFHSATYCNGFGIPVVGAKAFDKKVIGKVTKKLTFCTTRASRAAKPAKIPTHESAYPNASRNKKASEIFKIPDVGRQPTR